MNENINLCKLLKGHEGEIFYSPAYGNVTLISIGRYDDCPIEIHNGKDDELLTKYGKICDNKEAECILFPSKDQRDWNKWVEEQKPKVPKTWSEMEKCNGEVWQATNLLDYGTTVPILKSVLAFLKIHQLIEVSYGGNITNEEWDDDRIIKYTIKASCNNIVSRNTFKHKDVLAFHTKEQRDEFLSYPENVQLVEDFYQIK